MENVEFLAGAFALFWGLTFAYMFSIARRQAQLEQELRTLERLIDQEYPE